MSLLITGMGAVASVGGSHAEIFASLCAGRSGRNELLGFDRTRFRTRHAFEIDDRPALGVDVPLRATRWLVQAIEAAVADAGLDDLTGVPVLIGTTLRELRSVELHWRDGATFAVEDLHFGAALAERFGTSSSYTVANACSASLYALALGADLLELHEADTVVVAGVDTFTESTFGLLDRCYPEPPELLRPFDRDRQGMMQGEGAAAVVVRRERDGAGSGKAHARLTGVAINCDAYHSSAPDAASITRVIRDAHRRAEVEPNEVDLVLLHGTGTVLNDEAEATAIGEVFAGAAPYLTAIKSMTGHTGGAAGLHSLLVAVESLRTGRVPPILDLENPIPAVAGFRLVTGRSATEALPLSVAQIDSFGFGGLNAVAVLEKVTP